MFMTRNPGDTVALQDGRAQTHQRFILTVFKEVSGNPFKLDADRVVVAIAAAPVTLDTGMPGAIIGADELPEFTRAADVEMRRHGRAPDAFKVGMPAPVKPIGKQALHRVTTILPGRQADAMQHNQINLRRWRTRAEIGRRQPSGKLVPAVAPKRRLGRQFRALHRTLRHFAACRYATWRCDSVSGAGSSPVGPPPQCG